jgi:hypothetical protein
LAIWLMLKALHVRDIHIEKLLWTLVALVSLTMPGLMQAVALRLPPPASVVARTFQFNNTLAEPVIKTMQVKFSLAD